MLNFAVSRRRLIQVIPSVIGLSAFARCGNAAAADDMPNTADKDAGAKTLERSACVIFEMSITQETMSALQNTFVELHRQRYQNVTLMMNSFGGNVSTAIAAYHFVNTLGINLTTYNMSDVSSAAVIIYLAGKTRLANEQSRFQFHAAKNEYQGTFGAEDLNNFSTDVEEVNTRIKEIYRSKMNLADSEYSKYLGQTFRSVRAQEALRIGLVTRIDDPSLAASALFPVPVPTAKNTF